MVGISGYTVRPPEARSKPKISSFIKADFDRITALKPDLVLAFSDLQADICAELIRRGLPVFAFNQRSVAEILEVIRQVGAIVGLETQARKLADSMLERLEEVARQARRLPRRVRVFFEEWPDPLISGIRWVSELIEIAGGEDLFPELRICPDAKRRIVTPAEVARRDPELIVASWCGRKMNAAVIRSRPGWGEIAAVRTNRIVEIKSSLILQPGPAALTDGLDRLASAIRDAASA